MSRSYYYFCYYLRGCGLKMALEQLSGGDQKGVGGSFHFSRVRMGSWMRALAEV